MATNNNEPLRWESDEWRLGDLAPWNHNPRQIRESEAKRLADSLDEFGQVETIAITPSGEVVNGHQRLNVLLEQHGINKFVDVRVANRELTHDERKRITVALHETATGEWNFDALGNLFDFDELIDLGFPEWKLADLNDDIEPDDHRDPAPPRDDATPLLGVFPTEPGDVWALGDHRVICGDSTDANVVEQLFDDRRLADVVWTDPPYGINFGDKTISSDVAGWRQRDIENDDRPADEFEAFLRSALWLAHRNATDTSPVYVCAPPGDRLPYVIAAFRESGWLFHWQLVWVKQRMVFGRADYHPRHENILYGWKKGESHYFTDDRTQTTVFEYDNPIRSDYHPTMKPVELVQQMLRNSSKPGDIVYDPFLGSGSTLLAAELSGRVCRGVEIEPRYCAVICQRYLDTTGVDPVKVSVSPV